MLRQVVARIGPSRAAAIMTLAVAAAVAVATAVFGDPAAVDAVDLATNETLVEPMDGSGSGGPTGVGTGDGS